MPEVPSGRGGSVQSLIMSKSKFETKAAAQKWAKDNGFRFGSVDETDKSFRLRQINPSECDSLRNKSLDTGVTAVLCIKGSQASDMTADDIMLFYDRVDLKDAAKRFWGKVRKLARCWEWTELLSEKGYGRFWMGDRMVKAHKVAWLLSGRMIPKGKMLMHRCDNRKCVNPRHMSLGTNQDNVDDRESKGRGNYER